MKPIPAVDISEGMLTLEQDLSGSVTRSLGRALSTATGDIRDHLKAGRFEEAKGVARELTFTDALEATTKSVRRFTRSAALLGAGTIDSPATSIMATGGGFPFEVDTAAPRLIKNMIGHILTRDTRRRILEQIGRAERFQKAADPIDPSKLANDINRFLRGEIRRVVDVSANIVGTRVSAYGMLYEARARGISKYRIDAVIDDRTTEICRNMNGRTFEVEFAFTKTQTLLNTTNPTDQKKLAPFPELDQIRELSDAELQARGHDTPPFHFLCRSVVTMIDNIQETEYPPIPKFPDKVSTPSQGELADFFVERREQVLETFETDFGGLLGGGDPLVKAVKAYTGSSYRRINAGLRKNDPQTDASIKGIIADMDKAFDKAKPADKDMIVYRGVSANISDRMGIGKVFQDDGFMSTSVSPGFARSWEGTVMQIHLPKNAPHIPVDEFSSNPGEFEIVVARASQFRIIGRDKITIDGSEITVIRAVWQGIGEKNSADQIGSELPSPPESVVKAEGDREDKFVYGIGDLKEVSMLG